MKGRTSIKKASDALWQTSSSLREAFPEYIKEQDGKLLSPYDSLPPLKIGGEPLVVAEGTGAVRAYEAMVYGVEKDEPEMKENWKRLLLQYCKLDTLSMVMVWRHWRENAGRGGVAQAFEKIPGGDKGRDKGCDEGRDRAIWGNPA